MTQQQIQNIDKIDPRLIRVDVEVNGQIKSYNEDFYISVKGTKFANSLQNEAEIKIGNVDPETQNYLLSQTSPFNKNHTPKTINVYAGRQSYGLFKIFTGNIVTVKPTQPPDIFITLKCLTGNYKKGQITSRTGNSVMSLSQISKQTAGSLGLNLDFQATDKQINNYTYSGAALKEVNRLSEMGTVDAYIDNDRLVVKDSSLPLSNIITIVSPDTGLVGISEATEQGLKVKYMLGNKTTLGGGLQLNSKLYESLNGLYVIYKLSFEVESRDVPFYWIAEAIAR